jgi:tRNA (guanine-N7-)-methyltransferase
LGLLHGLDLEINYANHDVYKNEGSPKEVLEIQTFYENQYLEKGKPITYVKFRVH